MRQALRFEKPDMHFHKQGFCGLRLEMHIRLWRFKTVIPKFRNTYFLQVFCKNLIDIYEKWC